MELIPSAVIAAFTAALFLLQWWAFRHHRRVQDADFKLRLFDKRMEVYRAVEECLLGFVTDVDSRREKILEVRRKCRDAGFLFPEAPAAYLEEIVEKTVDYDNARHRWEKLQSKSSEDRQLTTEEENRWEKTYDTMNEIASWFAEQYSHGLLKKELGPYLDLPEKL